MTADTERWQQIKLILCIIAINNHFPDYAMSFLGWLLQIIIK